MKKKIFKILLLISILYLSACKSNLSTDKLEGKVNITDESYSGISEETSIANTSDNSHINTTPDSYNGARNEAILLFVDEKGNYDMHDLDNENYKEGAKKELSFGIERYYNNEFEKIKNYNFTMGEYWDYDRNVLKYISPDNCVINGENFAYVNENNFIDFYYKGKWIKDIGKHYYEAGSSDSIKAERIDYILDDMIIYRDYENDELTHIYCNDIIQTMTLTEYFSIYWEIENGLVDKSNLCFVDKDNNMHKYNIDGRHSFIMSNVRRIEVLPCNKYLYYIVDNDDNIYTYDIKNEKLNKIRDNAYPIFFPDGTYYYFVYNTKKVKIDDFIAYDDLKKSKKPVLWDYEDEEKHTINFEAYDADLEKYIKNQGRDDKRYRNNLIKIKKLYDEGYEITTSDVYFYDGEKDKLIAKDIIFSDYHTNYLNHKFILEACDGNFNYKIPIQELLDGYDIYTFTENTDLLNAYVYIGDEGKVNNTTNDESIEVREGVYDDIKPKYEWLDSRFYITINNKKIDLGDDATRDNPYFMNNNLYMCGKIYYLEKDAEESLFTFKSCDVNTGKIKTLRKNVLYVIWPKDLKNNTFNYHKKWVPNDNIAKVIPKDFPERKKAEDIYKEMGMYDEHEVNDFDENVVYNEKFISLYEEYVGDINEENRNDENEEIIEENDEKIGNLEEVTKREAILKIEKISEERFRFKTNLSCGKELLTFIYNPVLATDIEILKDDVTYINNILDNQRESLILPVIKKTMDNHNMDCMVQVLDMYVDDKKTTEDSIVIGYNGCIKYKNGRDDVNLFYEFIYDIKSKKYYFVDKNKESKK